MGINRASGAGETSFSLLHQHECSKKYKALSFARSFGLMALSFFALMLISDKGWSQQRGPSALSQQGGQSGAHRLYTRVKENPVTPAITAASTIEPTSPLGQALASCDRDTAVQETFALPGLKGEVTLDRCYKGHDHLICVFDALITEAKSLTDSYSPIVDAKYPDFNSVESICQIKPDALTSPYGGSRRFCEEICGTQI